MVKSGVALIVLFHVAITVPLNTIAGEGGGVIPSDPCDPSAQPSSSKSCKTPVRDMTQPWRSSPGENSAKEHQEAGGSGEKHTEDKEASQPRSKRSDGGDLPYVYDASAKPLGGLRPDGAGPYPLFYTSYHLFAPSPAESRHPGIEYFGEPPESTDPEYYGLYQDLARDVFKRRYGETHKTDERQAEMDVEPGGHHRRLRNLQESEEAE